MQTLNKLKKTTFLGVNIDEHLTWNDHIDMIEKKLMKSSAIISKSRHINMNTRKLLYYGLSISYLQQHNMG
jgi:hypothetical protein